MIIIQIDEVIEQNQVLQYKHIYVKLITQEENFKKGTIYNQ